MLNKHSYNNKNVIYEHELQPKNNNMQYCFIKALLVLQFNLTLILFPQQQSDRLLVMYPSTLIILSEEPNGLFYKVPLTSCC